MNTVVTKLGEMEPEPTAVSALVTDTAVRITLSDGRELSAPLAWFPRLADGTPAQRAYWELADAGYGIHWPDVDKDISVRALMSRPT